MAVSMHLEARSGFRRSSSDFAVTSNSPFHSMQAAASSVLYIFSSLMGKQIAHLCSRSPNTQDADGVYQPCTRNRFFSYGSRGNPFVMKSAS
jgi:hypothetical protein